MMQDQEEDKDQISTEKEQRAVSSNPTGKDLLLIQCVLSLHYFLQSSIPQNLGVPSKATTLATDNIFFFMDRLLHLQALFRVAGKCDYGRRIAIHKLVIGKDDLHQYIDEPHIKGHHQRDHKCFWPPYLISLVYWVVPHFVILIVNKLIGKLYSSCKIC